MRAGGGQEDNLARRLDSQVLEKGDRGGADADKENGQGETAGWEGRRPVVDGGRHLRESC